MSRIRVDHEGLAALAAEPSRTPRHPSGTAPLLGLQALVGNRAVSQVLVRRMVQRCGPGSNCDCPPEERALNEAGLAAQSPSVQRAADQAGADTPPGGAAADQAAAGPQPSFGPALRLPESDARSLINECCAVLGGVATQALRWPDTGSGGEAVASTEPEQAAAAVQTMPVAELVQRAVTVQRAGGGSSVNVEVGVVGSVQACYDFCTGDLDLSGWIWAGIGSRLPLAGWVGPYYFHEGQFGKINIGSLLRCGACAADCVPASGGNDGGWGIAGFPVHVDPGQRARFSKGGVEFGVLITPHSLCDADIEAIVLFNLLGYLGPAGAAITRFVDGINQVGARYGINVLLEFGVQFNGGGHLCRSAGGGVSADHISLCGGGFVGGGVGLSRDKNALPH